MLPSPFPQAMDSQFTSRQGTDRYKQYELVLSGGVAVTAAYIMITHSTI